MTDQDQQSGVLASAMRESRSEVPGSPGHLGYSDSDVVRQQMLGLRQIENLVKDAADNSGKLRTATVKKAIIRRGCRPKFTTIDGLVGQYFKQASTAMFMIAQPDHRVAFSQIEKGVIRVFPVAVRACPVVAQTWQDLLASRIKDKDSLAVFKTMMVNDPQDQPTSMHPGVMRQRPAVPEARL